MGDLISKLPINALAIIAFVVAFGFVILVLLFVHAYFSGREVALWPPKIGAKKSNGENKKDFSKSLVDGDDLVGKDFQFQSKKDLIAIDQDLKKMYIDLRPAIKMGQLLGIDEKDIVNYLVKKIRAHQVAFSIPRRAVLLPFMDGEYFGIFSWQDDIIVCHSIFAMPGDADPEMWKLWNDMLFIYNDTYGSRYRIPDSHPTPKDFKNPLRNISDGIKSAQSFIEKFPSYNTPDVKIILQEATNSLERAETILNYDETSLPIGEIISNLEMALSYLHDVIDMCRPPITLRSSKR